MIIVINNSILPYFIALIKGKKITYFYFKEKSANILVQLENFLKKNKIKFEKITGIIFILNQFSFTGLRMATTIANIFNIFCNLSISQVMTDEAQNIIELIKIGQRSLRKKLILPVYHKEPNITIR